MGFLDGLTGGSKAERKYQEALAFQRAGSYKEAEAAYREVISIDPSFYKAYTNLGSVLTKNIKTGDPDSSKRFLEGVQYFTKALEIQPDDTIALFNIGTIHYLNFDDEEKAFDFFARAINADPRSMQQIEQYLSWASYHSREDFRKVVDRSIQLVTQKKIQESKPPSTVHPVFFIEHPPGENFEQYSNERYHVSYKIPKGWEQRPKTEMAGPGDEELTALYKPDGTKISIVVGPQNYGKNPSADDLERQAHHHMKNISGDLKTIQRRKIAGAEAVELDYIALLMRTKKIAVLWDNLEFLFHFSTPPQLYQYYEPLFNDIIESIRFSG